MLTDHGEVKQIPISKLFRFIFRLPISELVKVVSAELQREYEYMIWLIMRIPCGTL